MRPSRFKYFSGLKYARDFLDGKVFFARLHSFVTTNMPKRSK